MSQTSIKQVLLIYSMPFKVLSGLTEQIKLQLVGLLMKHLLITHCMLDSQGANLETKLLVLKKLSSLR